MTREELVKIVVEAIKVTREGQQAAGAALEPAVTGPIAAALITAGFAENGIMARGITTTLLDKKT